jgi:hypothetical protein
MLSEGKENVKKIFKDNLSNHALQSFSFLLPLMQSYATAVPG